MLNDSNKMSVAAAPPSIAGNALIYSATGYIKEDTHPNALRITEASKRVRIDLLQDTGKDYFLRNYTDGKCTIADLIWWELEEVTE